MSKGVFVVAFFVISFIYYLLGSPFGGGPSDDPGTDKGVCSEFTSESGFAYCMENQYDGGDFPAP